MRRGREDWERKKDMEPERGSKKGKGWEGGTDRKEIGNREHTEKRDRE